MGSWELNFMEPRVLTSVDDFSWCCFFFFMSVMLLLCFLLSVLFCSRLAAPPLSHNRRDTIMVGASPLLGLDPVAVGDGGDRRVERTVVGGTSAVTQQGWGRGRAVLRLDRPCAAATGALCDLGCRRDVLDEELTCGGERVLLCSSIVSYAATVLSWHVVFGMEVMASPAFS